MDFFEQWGRNLENVLYIYYFLEEREDTIHTLGYGFPEQEEMVYRVLTHVELERFIDCICRLKPKDHFEKSDVPVFSDFQKASIRVPELLEFSPDGLGFDALGYQLMHCQGKIAQKKYGENQAKLAELLGLVSISVRKPRVVKLTSWGLYLIPVPWENKASILKRMTLRNAYIQFLIREACKGSVNYRDTVDCLANSTVVRCRTNVRKLMEFILKGSKRESLLKNIDWTV